MVRPIICEIILIAIFVFNIVYIIPKFRAVLQTFEAAEGVSETEGLKALTKAYKPLYVSSFCSIILTFLVFMFGQVMGTDALCIEAIVVISFVGIVLMFVLAGYYRKKLKRYTSLIKDSYDFHRWAFRGCEALSVVIAAGVSVYNLIQLIWLIVYVL